MSTAGTPDLVGLVLAGGGSRRMGQDKGALIVHGRPQVEHCLALVAPFCLAARVSIRPVQAQWPAYRELPQIVDAASVDGPASGLLAAFSAFPGCALLVLAVDLPLVDRDVLSHLTAGRDPARTATAYRHPDGILEPLCTIYEPGAARALERAAQQAPAPSLRRLLEDSDVAVLEPPDPARLISANTPEALAVARRALGRVRSQR